MPALIIFHEHGPISNPDSVSTPPLRRSSMPPNAEQLHARTKAVAELFPGEKFLFYSDYPHWNDDWDINIYRKQIQRGETLVERLSAAFGTAFEEGHDRALFVGNQCSRLTGEMLLEALDALESHDVVIGPADDGTPFLLGMKAVHAELLDGHLSAILNVQPGTSAALQGVGLSCYLLRQLPVEDAA